MAENTFKELQAQMRTTLQRALELDPDVTHKPLVDLALAAAQSVRLMALDYVDGPFVLRPDQRQNLELAKTHLQNALVDLNKALGARR